MLLRIEDISFIGVCINDSFRDFKDINDYANYHVSLLNNKDTMPLIVGTLLIV